MLELQGGVPVPIADNLQAVGPQLLAVPRRLLVPHLALHRQVVYLAASCTPNQSTLQLLATTSPTIEVKHCRPSSSSLVQPHFVTSLILKPTRNVCISTD